MASFDQYVPMRPTYFNLYKWPESDMAFVRSLRSDNADEWQSRFTYGGEPLQSGFSRRQSYLRSYTFSREEDYTTWLTNCLAGFKNKRKRMSSGGGRIRRNSTDSIFRRLLLCITKIDVVD